MQGLIAELKRRNVFRVGVAYLALAWVVIQITDMAVPALNLPPSLQSIVFYIGMIGFPFALLFAWAFEMTPEGLKREHEVDRTASITPQTGRKVDFAIIGLLVVALSFVVWDSYLSKPDVVLPNAEEASSTAPPPMVVEASVAPVSIAVLPFADMSADKDQEYFSDGIAEELLNALSKLKNLQVAARTSSFAFKGQNQDITEIGNKLNVGTVLEGSVRKSGTRLRITAQLIDVENGYHLWSETYDRELTDVFAVQDELTTAIVAALKVHLDVGEGTSSATTIDNWEAYDAYLKGIHEVRKRTEESMASAVEYFEKATRLEPTFAAAMAHQAQALLLEASYGIRPRAEATVTANALLARALILNPDLAEAHTTKGFLLLEDNECEQALVSFDRAIALNPGLVEALHWRSNCLTSMGRLREGLESIQRAYRLDPRHASVLTALANYESDYGMDVGLDLGAALKLHPERYYSYTLVSAARSKHWAQMFKQIKDNPDRGLAEAWEFAVSTFLKQEPEQLLNRSDETQITADFYLEIMLDWGRFEEAERYLESLEHNELGSTAEAHFGRIQYLSGRMDEAESTLSGLLLNRSNPITDNMDRPHSLESLAMALADILQRQGRDQAARKYMLLVRDKIDLIKGNGAVVGYQWTEARLQVLEGNIPAALDSLDWTYDTGLFAWFSFDDPIIKRLAEEPRLIALQEKVYAHTNAERAKLGWPPVEF